MDKNIDIILVTGATGQQGGAVARELLSNGYKVRAMTRNPEGDAARALATLGAQVVKGDLDDVASLEAAIDGAWGVFAVQNSWEAGVEQEEVQGKRIAELAKKLGVQHFVYSSVGSAHRATGIPHFDNKWRVEEMIRGLDLPSFTILRPVFFMENLLSPWYKPAIDEGKLTITVKPDTKLQMIAVKDIGRYGLLAFEKHDDLNGRAIDIAGDEKTMTETAELLTKGLGHAVVLEPTPIKDVRAFSEDVALMLEWFDKVGYESSIAGNVAEFGIEPTGLEWWLVAQVASA